MRSQLFLIGIVAIVVMTGAARADDTEDVRRLDVDITVATWTGDAEWFEQHLADDYVLITPSGSMRTKSDVIRELATADLEMDPYEPLDVDVRLYGETAVVTGRMFQRFTVGRVRYANDLRYTGVWVKKKGKWLLVSGHTSNIAGRR